MRTVVIIAALWGGVFLTGAGVFQPPLTEIQARVETNGYDVLIRYEVSDPVRPSPVAGSYRYTGNAQSRWVVSELTVAEGVVGWRAAMAGTSTSADAEVGYALYDPARAGWIAGRQHYDGTSLIYWVTSDLAVGGGLLAWKAVTGSAFDSWYDTVIGYAAYDAARGSWRAGEQRYEGASFDYWVATNLTVLDHVVAWQAATTGSRPSWNTEIRFATYDSRLGSWVVQGKRYQGTSLNYWVMADLILADGLLAWQADTDGSVSAYDTEVGYAIYDSSRLVWASGARLHDGSLNNRWTISGLRVENQSVRWTAADRSGSSEVSRGYYQPTGVWDTSSTKAWARFVPSIASGLPPLGIWFSDLSLGATNWSWNFGDGTTSRERNPFHWYDLSGRYTVTLNVSGPRGTSWDSRVITVEGTVGQLVFDVSTARVTGNQFRVVLTGMSDRRPVVIQASSDLVRWQPVITNPPTAGPLEFSETLDPRRPARFYRATQP